MSWKSRSVTIGVAASVLAPAAADSAVMTNRAALAVSFSDPETSVGWDVDGDGMDEFRLTIVTTDIIVGSENRVQERILLTSSGLKGFGFLGTDTAEPGIKALNPGDRVGPTLATGTWGIPNDPTRFLAGHTVTFSEPAFGTSWLAQRGGDQLIGFRFNGRSGLQYGWAIINVNLDGGDTRVTIEQWSYETNADTAVIASEPPLVAPSLALLGLGAAGVRRWRQIRQASGDQ